MPSGIYTRTKEHNNRISETHKRLSILPPSRKGVVLSDETKGKMSEAHKRNPYSHWKGKHLSEEHKKILSESCKGNKSHLWKGGITPINATIRCRAIYRNWRNSVFERDNWACKKCGKRGVRIQAHHIKEFSKFHDLRFETKNGLTLCVKCHGNIHNRKINDIPLKYRRVNYYE